jgi:TM2 domain-containing membrane protein YozV
MKKRKQVKTKKPSQGIAIAALLLNILIIPGLGTLIAGRTKTGIWQIVLAIISIPLIFVFIGIPLLIAVWIWGLVTGIQLIKEAG